MSKVSLKEKLLANGRAHLYLEYRLNGQRIKQLLERVWEENYKKSSLGQILFYKS
jgi:hypothetical protein